MWADIDSKLYKVANFPNSDGEPFGLTIKGKGKHVDAHNKVMDTINRLPKNKAMPFGQVKLTVTDKVKTNTLLNAKVTLTNKNNVENQVELKIHKPSDRRHKATIEVRRLTGHDFEAVEEVMDLLTKMLDDFTLGETVSRVIIKTKGKQATYTPLVKQPSLQIELLSCKECDFSTKTMSTLKSRMSKNHKYTKNKCDICGFDFSESDMKDHMSQFHQVHQTIRSQNKQKRKKDTICCDECGITVDSQKKLKRKKRKAANKAAKMSGESHGDQNKPGVREMGVEQGETAVPTAWHTSGAHSQQQ